MCIPRLTHAMRPKPGYIEFALLDSGHDVSNTFFYILQATLSIIGTEKYKCSRADRSSSNLR
jgi:hypothetical protein